MEKADECWKIGGGELERRELKIAESVWGVNLATTIKAQLFFPA